MIVILDTENVVVKELDLCGHFSADYRQQLKMQLSFTINENLFQLNYTKYLICAIAKIGDSKMAVFN